MFLASSMAQQLVKRKKHWAYIHRMRVYLTSTITDSFFKRGYGEIFSIKVSINGKINGRDRSTNYIFHKAIKDDQHPPKMLLSVKIDFAFKEALSKYGVINVKV